MKVRHLVETKVEVEEEGKTQCYITIRQFENKGKQITIALPTAAMIIFPASRWEIIQDGVEKALREDEITRKMLRNV